MRFSFEADMKKGECYACPCCYSSDEDYSKCSILDETVPNTVTPEECPLKEVVDNIEWHPYPKEKPSKRGQYIVTAIDQNTLEPYTVASGWYKWDNGVYSFGIVSVVAWAKMPKPYEG